MVALTARCIQPQKTCLNSISMHNFTGKEMPSGDNFFGTSWRIHVKGTQLVQTTRLLNAELACLANNDCSETRELFQFRWFLINLYSGQLPIHLCHQQSRTMALLKSSTIWNKQRVDEKFSITLLDICSYSFLRNWYIVAYVLMKIEVQKLTWKSWTNVRFSFIWLVSACAPRQDKGTMTAVKAAMSPSRHWRRSIIKNTFSKFYTIGGIMKCNKQMERCLTVRFPTAQSLIRVALVSIEKHDQTHNKLCVFGTAIVKLCFQV